VEAHASHAFVVAGTLQRSVREPGAP